MKRLLFSFIFILLLVVKINAIQISGSVDILYPAVVSVYDGEGNVFSKDLNTEDKTFILKVDAEEPEIVTLFVNYSASEGDKRQTYTPLYIDPSYENHSINISQHDNEIIIGSNDIDQKALIDYSEFLKLNLSKNVPDERIDDFLNSLVSAADNLQSEVVNSLTSNYLKLWGISSRKTAEQIVDRMAKVRGGNKPDYIPYNLEIDSLISNPATIYFPQFFGAISREKASGESFPEKIMNLRENMDSGKLRDAIENRMINSFVNQNKGKTDSKEIIAVLDTIANDNPRYKEWVEMISGYRSFIEPGDEVPDDILYDLEGNKIRLSDFKGKYLFIDFWASWCTYCIRELPALHKIQNDFSDKDIQFIGISLDADPENWKKAVEKYNLANNQYIVSTPEFAQKLELNTIPRYMLYDPNGRLINGTSPRPSNYEKLSELFNELPPLN